MTKRMSGPVVPAMVVVLLLLFSGPARGHDRGEISVPHGQSVSKEFPAVALPMPLANLSYNPNSCTTAAYCDRMKLKVGLAAKPEEARLQIVLEWKGAPQPTPLNYCILYVWDDPEGPADVKRASCVDNVATLDLVPIKSNYQIVVRNFTATNSEGYTLKLSYK